jgi:hypothetical protein
MPELSNLLRQRLEAGESVSSAVHPDADTLTAYVEQLLPPAERNGVVSHLSVCAQCREVVAFSLPQLTEVVAQSHAPVPASFWSRLWTPGFRWAGAMAVIAVAAALVVELPRRQQGATQGPQSETSQSAQDAQQPKEAPAPEQPAVSGLTQASADKATKAKTLAAPSAPPPPVRSEARLQQPGFKDLQPAGAAFPAKKETAGRPVAEEAKSAGFVAGAGKQDYVANYLFAANDAKANSAFEYLPQAPAPQLTSQPGVAAGPPVHTPIFGGISGTPDTTANKKSKFLRLERLACIFCKVADIGVGKTAPTSPVITSGAVMTSAMDLHGKGSTLLKDPPAMTAAATEKSVSGGELDRSEIFARRAAAATASPKLREGASAQYHWKVAEGKLFKSLDQDQWEDAYPRADANFEFSVVTAHGADVWAGGTHATLLHSRDGVIWEPVRLGDSASGKIVSVAASGLSVQVQTSTNQVWSSSDAGKTWVLQSGN